MGFSGPRRGVLPYRCRYWCKASAKRESVTSHSILHLPFANDHDENGVDFKQLFNDALNHLAGLPILGVSIHSPKKRWFRGVQTNHLDRESSGIEGIVVESVRHVTCLLRSFSENARDILAWMLFSYKNCLALHLWAELESNLVDCMVVEKLTSPPQQPKNTFIDKDLK